MASIRYLLALAVALGGCRIVATPTPPATASELLLPGDRDLAPAGLHESSGAFTYFIHRTEGTDTTERRGPSGTAAFVRPDASSFLASFFYPPPQNSADSLWIDSRSLSPRHEWLRLGEKTLNIDYNGGRVHVAVTEHGASSVRDTTFAQPVFAFNEVETLVRSIPLRRGYSRVVPLYSEAEHKVEYDTLTVIGPVGGRLGFWDVRFADPVIVQRWVIDDGRHEIAEMETRPRKAPVVMRRAGNP